MVNFNDLGLKNLKMDLDFTETGMDSRDRAENWYKC